MLLNQICKLLSKLHHMARSHVQAKRWHCFLFCKLHIQDRKQEAKSQQAEGCAGLQM